VPLHQNPHTPKRFLPMREALSPGKGNPVLVRRVDPRLRGGDEDVCHSLERGNPFFVRRVDPRLRGGDDQEAAFSVQIRHSPLSLSVQGEGCTRRKRESILCFWSIIPSKEGVQSWFDVWTPASAGVTTKVPVSCNSCHSLERGNPVVAFGPSFPRKRESILCPLFSSCLRARSLTYHFGAS
jgi:hypothetical protein